MTNHVPRPVFTGVAAALVTFFDEHGHVDAAATAAHAERVASHGVQAIVVAGTTGEASHLSMKERLTVLDAVKAAIGGQIPVILGTGNLPPGVKVPELTKRAGDHGADAALVLSPHSGDVREFFGEVVGAAGKLPVIAYHYPAVSCSDGISIEELKALKVAGIKDSCGDPERLLDEVVHYHGPVYTGNSALTLYAGSLGCAGAVLAAANLEPELCMNAFAGHVQAQKDLLHAHQIVSRKGVKGIKEELAHRHGTSTACR
jgi:4-hydroxy-tetrahydrodipicolinate synthase